MPIKIPRKIRKELKEEAKTESGSRGSSLSDVEKSKRKANRMTLIRQSKVGQKLGKVFGKGNYNIIGLREGAKLDKPIEDTYIPPKPTLLKQGVMYRNFTKDGEKKEKRFNVSGTSEQEIANKIKTEVEKRDIVFGDGVVERLSKDMNGDLKYNEEVNTNLDEDKIRRRYVKNSRTDAMKSKLKGLKKSNKNNSNRDNYRKIKEKKFDNYRFEEQVKRDKVERLRMLGLEK